MYSDAILTSTDTLKNETMGLDKKASTIANSIEILNDNDEIFLEADIASLYLFAPISLPIITTAALARPNVTIINKFITVEHI